MIDNTLFLNGAPIGKTTAVTFPTIETRAVPAKPFTRWQDASIDMIVDDVAGLRSWMADEAKRAADKTVRQIAAYENWIVKQLAGHWVSECEFTIVRQVGKGIAGLAPEGAAQRICVPISVIDQPTPPEHAMAERILEAVRETAQRWEARMYATMMGRPYSEK